MEGLPQRERESERPPAECKKISEPYSNMAESMARNSEVVVAAEWGEGVSVARSNYSPVINRTNPTDLHQFHFTFYRERQLKKHDYISNAVDNEEIILYRR
jgi:hypothetical protein